MSRLRPFPFLFLITLATLAAPLWAATTVPGDADYSGRKGTTLYVSKAGDNSDGSSWARAFHKIQDALNAVPDAEGGHRVIVRPDNYMEPNLETVHKGAAGAYNLLIGDVDGSLGSGAKGWVVVDAGDAKTGFKSWDWWTNMRASTTNWNVGNNKTNFSCIVWDRWALRNIYATGSDAGLFWDLTHENGKPFTVLVEDCVGIGRAFGGGVAYPAVRKDEPCMFRRCYFLALDWGGDTGAVLIGGWKDSMPDSPHVVFEDCTLVHPDNAVQVSFASLAVRAKFKDCRMIVLNFSQPQISPSTGIICCQTDKSKLHVDLEDCILAGYSVFRNGLKDKRITYTTKGKVQAYVQFQQSVPKGFERLGTWPTKLFSTMAPTEVVDGVMQWKGVTKAAFHATPNPSKTGTPVKEQKESQPKLTKLPEVLGKHVMETTPIVFNGRRLLFHSNRPAGHAVDLENTYLCLMDMQTGKEVARFGQEHSFGSAFVQADPVKGDTVHVFAAEYTQNDWTHNINHFWSKDLKNWQKGPAIKRRADEHLFNSSVCHDGDGYVMAYESNKPIAFCFRFARSKNLCDWETVEESTFTGKGGEYSACPVIRYFAPYYYVIFVPPSNPAYGYASFLMRSKDLKHWQLSPRNPVLKACEGEGINNSDVDLIELDGKTYLNYATGDQSTWLELKRAVYPAPMKEFFESYFPDGVKMEEVSTVQ